ncbi:LuxR C-terminal-related transcriptional regulator [Streptomyces sp. NPDC060053]|uniref:LuxR C-terminal-related transcriptional regulator n=1 Tax=Streptomyces sp. NPDC060053 TaxID=3347047 RepID=UPI0036AD02D9
MLVRRPAPCPPSSQRLRVAGGERAQDDQDQDVRRGQRSERGLDPGGDRQPGDDDRELPTSHQRAARTPAHFFEALKAGAGGYVLKSVADRDLVEACRAVVRDEPFICPGAERALVRSYLDRLHRGGGVDGLPARPITEREEEILKLVAEGHTSREIGALLFISAKTVERHRANLLHKLGIRDRLELTRYAIRAGLIDP